MLFLLILPVTYLSFFLKFKSSRVNFQPVPLNFRRGNRREHFFFDHSDFSWIDAEDSNLQMLLYRPAANEVGETDVNAAQHLTPSSVWSGPLHEVAQISTQQQAPMPLSVAPGSIVFPGSFNPLHYGHIDMARAK